MSEKIKVPKKFFQVSNVETVIQVVKFFGLWLVPAVIALWIYGLDISLYVKIFSILFLSYVGGAHGIQCVGLLGHEGTHFALHKNKLVSSWLGVFFASFVPFHFDLGFAIFHADHHRFTNTDKDPDHHFFNRFKTFWSRLFLARAAASNRYIVATIKMALGLWPKDQEVRIGLAMKDLRILAIGNIIFSTVILSSYIVLTWFFPAQMIIILWIPTFFTVLISGLRPFVEHTQTHAERGRDSRSWISTYFDWTYGGINYHQAHHLFPSVPSFKLKGLHNWLVANGRMTKELEIYSVGEFIQSSAQKM